MSFIVCRVLLSVVGRCPLFVACGLLFAVCCSLCAVVGHWCFGACCLKCVIRCALFLVGRCFLLVVCCFFVCCLLSAVRFVVRNC